MKLSIYTFVRNGLYYDYHVVEMLRHHLPLADEIVVNEGYSTDGTYDAICNLDPKVKVIRNHEDRSDPTTWHIKFKNQARRVCTGDWCLLLDCDEFIPEWEFDRLRRTLATTRETILPIHFRHFYANYRVLNVPKGRVFPPDLGFRIHRNLETIEVWGDGANVRDQNITLKNPDPALAFECHHFGEVRHAARLRQKWRTQAKQHRVENPRWDWVPGFVFDLLPHRWDDPNILPYLQPYDGPYIQAVRNNPQEFVRDSLRLFRILDKQRTLNVDSMTR